MPFQWKEFEQAALLLESEAAKSTCPEACLRSAVSRYYYAAFCHARNYLRDHKGYIPKYAPSYDHNDHHQVRKHLEKCARHYPEFGKLVNKLYKLHEFRKQSDYDDELENLQLVVQSAREKSRQIISTLA